MSDGECINLSMDAYVEEWDVWIQSTMMYSNVFQCQFDNNNVRRKPKSKNYVTDLIDKKTAEC